MTQSITILQTDHIKQLAWLEKQIQKNNNSIFLNSKVALDAYEGLKGDNLIIPENDIEKFMARYLSVSGKKKLITTLRVAETRRKNSTLTMLQVNLEPNNNHRLTELSKLSGLTKTELINKMIQCAIWKKREEEQLEITL